MYCHRSRVLDFFYFGGFELSGILMPPTDNLIDRFGFDSKAETPNKLIRVYIQPGIAGTLVMMLEIGHHEKYFLHFFVRGQP